MFNPTTALTPSELKSAIVREPLIVAPDMKVMTAIAHMSGMRTICNATKTVAGQLDQLHLEARSSCVLVVEDQQLLGILTERDVVRLCAQQRPLENLAIREVMIHPVVTLQESAFTDLFFAVNLLQQHRIRHLPVLDQQNHLVGLLTHESLRQTSRPIDLLRLRLVSEVMTSQVVCAAPDSSMLAIVQRMAEHCVSSVMIVQPADSRAALLQIPVGILTERDVVQFQALGLNLETCMAQTVMSTPIFAVKPDDSLWVVQQMMEQRLIRRLAVTGEQGELLGIVTQTSLLQALNPLELYKLAEVLEEKVVHLEAEKVQLLENRTIELEQQVEARTIALKEQLVELQQTEARLRESEQRYIKLTAAAPVGIFHTNAVGQCTYVNDRWCQIAGLTPEAAAGEGWRQGLHPADRDIISSEWYRSAQENRPFCLEYRFQRPDGSVTWVYGQSVAEQDANGQLIGYIGTITDVSEAKRDEVVRKQAESALIQSEAQSRAILAAIPDFMFRMGADGIYRDCITANREINLFPPNFDATGEAMANVLPPEIATRQLHYLQQALQTGKLQVYEQHVQLGQRSQDEEVRVVKSGEDEVLFMIRDISDRKRSKEALQKSEAHLRALISAIPDLITRINREGIYLEFLASPNFHVVGNLAEIVGTHVSETLPPNVAQKRIEAIQLALQTNSIQIYEQDLSFDGRTQIEEVRIVPYSQDEVMALVRDISDRKQAELQLYQLNQDLEAKVETRTAELQNREAELQKLSERLSLSLKSGAIGCWEWDIRQDAIFWDERMYELYGLAKQSDAQIVYGLWTNALHPDDRLSGETLIKQAIGGQVEYDTEFRVVHPDGSIHFIKAYGVLVRDGQDNPHRLIGVNFDISERKQAEQTIHQQAERETLLREITQRIRQSLDLQTIFDTACQEIRQVIQADRVCIFKFYPESNYDEGEFVAESVVEGCPSVVTIRVHDHCFGKNYSSLYTKGKSYIIDDIYNGGMTACHADILAQFQVRSNLIMPLLCGEQLWGLLCIHQCVTIRHWQQSEVDFTQRLANQLAIAIQQANLYEQIQSELKVRQQAEARIALQLRRQETLGAIVQQIQKSLDVREILATVTQKVKEVMHGDRVIVLQFSSDGSQIVEEAVCGELVALKNRRWDNEVWSQEILDCYWQGKPRIVPNVTTDIWTHCPPEYALEGRVCSKIVAPILPEVCVGETHRWVAPRATNQLWGVLIIQSCYEKRIWQESEAQLLQQIANQLAIAIQQASLFEQLQQELTERQQAEAKSTESNYQLAISNQELARATRLKDEFLANMSHELRTPLNAILGMTEGLQEEIFGSVNKQQRKALQTIERSGYHLLELINDILDVAKIEAGQIELDYTSISVAHLCQSSLAFIKQQAMQKRIQLDIKLPSNLPELCVDERRIRQVFINLLNNAVKFTPEGGRITLQVKIQRAGDQTQPTEIGINTGSLILFSVIDTGIGIAPENIKKLFQPFIQIDSALNRQYAGTGLGLALVKRIVELHGGKVGLTSELGVGSCFTVELPCTLSSLHASEMPADDQPNATLGLNFTPLEATITQAPLILLVEDNEANSSTISSYLGAKGYRLLLAKNGQAAIDFAKTHQPDLILMDIQMPGMDGLEAMKQIRLDSNLVDIPIVALTALAMTGDREDCLEAGASDYLTKPIKLKQLAVTIQQLLDASNYK